jgi:hypothetical protein
MGVQRLRAHGGGPLLDMAVPRADQQGGREFQQQQDGHVRLPVARVHV